MLSDALTSAQRQSLCISSSRCNNIPYVCTPFTMQHVRKITDLKQRLTWHDPLADQLLSCASLLEFELEDCMETEEVRGETRGEQRVSDGC